MVTLQQKNLATLNQWKNTTCYFVGASWHHVPHDMIQCERAHHLCAIKKAPPQI